MTFNDLEFTLTFSPLLKSREQIQATVHFFVGGIGRFTFALFVPFASIEDATKDIERQLQAEAESVANRWGLQFSSAEDALDSAAYQSLAGQLSAITSSEFVVRRVVVRQIVPLSARLPAPPPLPVPQPPKPTRGERNLAALVEDVQTLDVLDAFAKRSQETHPHLWKAAMGRYGQLMDPPIKSRITSLIGRVLDPDGRD